MDFDFLKQKRILLVDDEQELLLDAIKDINATPSLSQAQYLKYLSKNGEINEDIVYEVLEEQKANQKEKLKIDLESL